ncbi:MAG TPA: D-alanyl-D-alanine carboxypeptidase family protein [Candidatus Paceibacterota bacterium]|nr:D-alanyl-D-alanine carboxypeptidase family protein [Candidatus Paceibacterota bacterium]
MIDQLEKGKNTAILLLGVLFVGSLSFGVIRSTKLSNELESKDQALKELQEKAAAYEADIALREAEKNELTNSLLAAQNEVEDISDQFEDVQDTVDKLEKLSKTDKELLQKYSKVYFLNEHYVPSSLKEIDSEYVLNKTQKLQIHTKVNPFLEDMFDEAEDDGINLRIISAYRSFASQSSLKSNYKVYYGSGANAFSADQGFSEHQLGTTLDLTTDALGANFENFETTEAYKWLQNNAYKYGFVLSYPRGNAYYVFEPWHWRFVGTRLAKKLHNDKKFFYDLDQRDIDKYLISIFD